MQPSLLAAQYPGGELLGAGVDGRGKTVLARPENDITDDHHPERTEQRDQSGGEGLSATTPIRPKMLQGELVRCPADGLGGVAGRDVEQAGERKGDVCSLRPDPQSTAAPIGRRHSTLTAGQGRARCETFPAEAAEGGRIRAARPGSWPSRST
jgi:hypothetical protein